MRTSSLMFPVYLIYTSLLYIMIILLYNFRAVNPYQFCLPHVHILNSIIIVNQLVIGANCTVTLVVGHSGVIDGRKLLFLQTRYCSLLLPVKPALLRKGRALQPLSDDLCLPCSPTASVSHSRISVKVNFLYVVIVGKFRVIIF